MGRKTYTPAYSAHEVDSGLEIRSDDGLEAVLYGEDATRVMCAIADLRKQVAQKQIGYGTAARLIDQLLVGEIGHRLMAEYGYRIE